MNDDRSLALALRSGDPRAARLLVERFGSAVMGLCIRMMGHRQDAEDVAQEVFVRAWKAAGRFDPSRPLRPWLLGIAANRCRTALSRRGRRPGPVPELDHVAEHRPALSDPDDLAGELERAIEKLRPEYRAVFVMFHEQGLPYEDIAVALGRPIGTVKTWLHRARAELADQLSRRGIHCSPRP